ncbi:MAG: DUF393 domain-containing protein [Proteobacteria bacterium]|nr:DUF393 domain-containing protein [Pseudomonadota bacterium]MBU1057825.1 DUF393 domain-containing protein [Pseudomonadota bacterium]
MKKTSNSITVFYDGSCSVCVSEMAHYRKKDRHGRLVLVDISELSFDPAQYGKTVEDFMAKLHVQDSDGRFFTGVNAFVVIWQALPGRFFRFLASFLLLPGIHFLAERAYALFARYRTILFPSPHKCDSKHCRFK